MRVSCFFARKFSIYSFSNIFFKNKIMANEKYVSMTKVIRFMNSYPPNWIQQAFAGDEHMARHLQSKWDGYVRDKSKSSYDTILRMVNELDNENLFTLMEYIDSLYAVGGNILNKGEKIILHSVDKSTEEDSYENGADPETRQHSFNEDIYKEFETPKEFFDYIERHYGVNSDDKSAFNSFEDGRITYSHLEDAEGSRASEKQMEDFRAGEKLWIGDYNFYIEIGTSRTPTTKEMAELFGIQEYKHGGIIPFLTQKVSPKDFFGK